MGKQVRRDLRTLLQVLQRDLHATLEGRLDRLGFPALRPNQVALLGRVSVDAERGVRLPDLVAALDLPKQTVGDMVNDLANGRLVERVADPEHGVIKRIKLGAMGKVWAAEVKRCAATTEARWAVRLGHTKIRSLRLLLEELAATVEPASQPSVSKKASASKPARARATAPKPARATARPTRKQR